MSWLRHIVFIAALAIPQLVLAMHGIFWQPQEKDLSVSPAQWQELMATLPALGLDTLVVQWTRYDTSFSGSPEREEITKMIQSARASGLKIILGLHWDSSFFDRVKQPDAALEAYLRKQRAQDVEQARIMVDRLGFVPDGFYISSEIDDENWRSQMRQDILTTWLNDTQTLITHEFPVPVYVSSFFSGKMTPTAYASLVTKMQDAGVVVWVQDAAGTQSQPKAVRDLYLRTVAQCGKNKHDASVGIVYELFHMTKTEPFEAVAAPAATINQLLRNPPCATAQSLYFSLRYLPASRGVLAIGDGH